MAKPTNGIMTHEEMRRMIRLYEQLDELLVVTEYLDDIPLTSTQRREWQRHRAQVMQTINMAGAALQTLGVAPAYQHSMLLEGLEVPIAGLFGLLWEQFGEWLWPQHPHDAHAQLHILWDWCMTSSAAGELPPRANYDLRSLLTNLHAGFDLRGITDCDYLAHTNTP